MPKKSSPVSKREEILAKLDDMEAFAILVLSKDGDRVYLHPFEDDIDALEFVEGMTSSLKTDILKQIGRRTLN